MAHRRTSQQHTPTQAGQHSDQHDPLGEAWRAVAGFREINKTIDAKIAASMSLLGLTVLYLVTQVKGDVYHRAGASIAVVLGMISLGFSLSAIWVRLRGLRTFKSPAEAMQFYTTAHKDHHLQEACTQAWSTGRIVRMKRLRFNASVVFFALSVLVFAASRMIP